MRLIIFGVILCLLPTCVYADLIPGPKARPAGDLALVVTASDSVKYIKDLVSTSSGDPVTIRRLTEIKPEQLAYCAFLVTGLTADKNNNVNYVINFKLIDPNGKVVFDVPRYAKGNGQTSVKPAFVMADPALDLVLEASDPPGTYLIEGAVEDLVSGKRAVDIYRIILRK